MKKTWLVVGLAFAGGKHKTLVAKFRAEQREAAEAAALVKMKKMWPGSDEYEVVGSEEFSKIGYAGQEIPVSVGQRIIDVAYDKSPIFMALAERYGDFRVSIDRETESVWIDAAKYTMRDEDWAALDDWTRIHAMKPRVIELIEI